MVFHSKVSDDKCNSREFLHFNRSKDLELTKPLLPFLPRVSRLVGPRMSAECFFGCQLFLLLFCEKPYGDGLHAALGETIAPTAYLHHQGNFRECDMLLALCEITRTSLNNIPSLLFLPRQDGICLILKWSFIRPCTLTWQSLWFRRIQRRYGTTVPGRVIHFTFPGEFELAFTEILSSLFLGLPWLYPQLKDTFLPRIPVENSPHVLRSRLNYFINCCEISVKKAVEQFGTKSLHLSKM